MWNFSLIGSTPDGLPSTPAQPEMAPDSSPLLQHFSLSQPRSSLRPPPKLHVQFSPHAAFTKTRDLRGKEKAAARWALLTSGQVESGRQYPRTMMHRFFAKRTDPPSSSLLFWLPASSFLPCLPPSPTHSGRRSLGHVTFITLQVSRRRRRALALASIVPSLWAIFMRFRGPLSPNTTGSPLTPF
jgi:hypothetical protein